MEYLTQLRERCLGRREKNEDVDSSDYWDQISLLHIEVSQDMSKVSAWVSIYIYC